MSQPVLITVRMNESLLVITSSTDAERAEELDRKQNTTIDVGDESFGTSLQYAPVGVAAAIIPWNYVSFNFQP